MNQFGFLEPVLLVFGQLFTEKVCVCLSVCLSVCGAGDGGAFKRGGHLMEKILNIFYIF